MPWDLTSAARDTVCSAPWCRWSPGSVPCAAEWPGWVPRSDRDTKTVRDVHTFTQTLIHSYVLSYSQGCIRQTQIDRPETIGETELKLIFICTDRLYTHSHVQISRASCAVFHLTLYSYLQLESFLVSLCTLTLSCTSPVFHYQCRCCYCLTREFHS